jgi:hypothetical protein
MPIIAKMFVSPNLLLEFKEFSLRLGEILPSPNPPEWVRVSELV